MLHCLAEPLGLLSPLSDRYYDSISKLDAKMELF